MTEKADAIVVGAGPTDWSPRSPRGSRMDVLVSRPNRHREEPCVPVTSTPDTATTVQCVLSPQCGIARVRRAGPGPYGFVVESSSIAVAHPLDAEDSNAPAVLPEAADTAAALERFRSGDGERWLELYRTWERIREPCWTPCSARFPTEGPVKLLRELGSAEALRIARFLLLPANRMGQELFAGEAAKSCSSAMHCTPTCTRRPDQRGDGIPVGDAGAGRGFQSPLGGAGALTDAWCADWNRRRPGGMRQSCRRRDRAGRRGNGGSPVRRPDVRRSSRRPRGRVGARALRAAAGRRTSCRERARRARELRVDTRCEGELRSARADSVAVRLGPPRRHRACGRRYHQAREVHTRCSAASSPSTRSCWWAR